MSVDLVEIKRLIDNGAVISLEIVISLYNLVAQQQVLLNECKSKHTEKFQV